MVYILLRLSLRFCLILTEDGKAVCIKLLDDILGTILNHRACEEEERRREEKKTSAHGSRPSSR